MLSAATRFAFGATVAFAQDPTRTGPRSQTRIPFSKDAVGDVAHVDTVKVFQTDTLRITTQLPGRVDTVRVNNTTTHYNTVQVMAPVPPMHLPGGLYFGIERGVSAPNGALYRDNSAGPSAQAQLGWQGANNPIGVRVGANYARPGDDSQYAGTQGNPSIVNADLKLALPFFHHLTGSRSRYGLYAIGGGSYAMYKDLPIRLNPGVPGGVPPTNIRVGPTN
ncbi:MAG: hypothetical protein ABJF01_01765 [bacterium]